MITSEQRARRSLDGLSVGDAFGEQFFKLSSEQLVANITNRIVPPTPWPYTDDTEMAISVVDVLATFKKVNQDTLVRHFAERMSFERGYGAGVYSLLNKIKAGEDWRRASPASFGGTGSFGNGAAMRVAPLGAYFADTSLEIVIEQARLSAEITHAHHEGIAGAVAVAVAAAMACRVSDGGRGGFGHDWLTAVRDATPESYTRTGLSDALNIPAKTNIVEVATKLGNGTGVTAADTVPICMWICAWYGRSYEDALWKTVSALGDRDTTCAIVGGVIAGAPGTEPIPEEWLAAREILPRRK